ncbi:MAG: glycosyltransferase family 2 protein [Alphaproteobacteria bacterium]|nr:MAG: glycosyltransferase family 2 protein [Alphaproteobacteria bacterium]
MTEADRTEKNDQRISVSVVIPAYNRGNLLGETLESILHQTALPREVIVVDDGSTDNTHEIALAYAKDHPFLKILRTENKGVQHARNAGIGAARGDWIALCDSDDLWSETYLEEVAKALVGHPEVDLLFTNFRHVIEGVWDETTKFSKAPKEYWERIVQFKDGDVWVLGGDLMSANFQFQPIFPSASVLSRVFVEDIGGFNEALNGVKAEDWEFTLRCLNAGMVAALAKPLVGIRKHAGNDSADQRLLLLGEIEIIDFVQANMNLDSDQLRVARHTRNLRLIQAINRAFDERLQLQVRDLYRQLTEPVPLRTTLKYWIACLSPSLFPLVRKSAEEIGGSKA